MNDRIAALAVWLLVLVVPSAGDAAGASRRVEENDTTRLAAVSQAIKSFEDDVSSALHDLPSNDAELIESYAYVELNLEPPMTAEHGVHAGRRFHLPGIIVRSAPDRELMHGQLLPQSKNFLQEKQNAIASMAAAHPANQIFAAYSDRAKVIFRDRAIPLLDELSRRIGDLQR